MSTETVPVQEDIVEVPEVEAEVSNDTEGQDVQAVRKEEQVPLSALQKERRKRQEIEQELRWHKEQMMKPQASSQVSEPDESLQEPATRQDLGNFRTDFKKEVKREFFEAQWEKDFPDRIHEVNEKLPELLKQRPHLASAISGAPNRYEEAWTLINSMTQKEKLSLKPQNSAKKDAPGNPSNVPKSTGMNHAVDVMAMNDSEFNQWRAAKRKSR